MATLGSTSYEVLLNLSSSLTDNVYKYVYVILFNYQLFINPACFAFLIYPIRKFFDII